MSCRLKCKNLENLREGELNLNPSVQIVNFKGDPVGTSNTWAVGL